jgi:hypothetical protein
MAFSRKMEYMVDHTLARWPYRCHTDHCLILNPSTFDNFYCHGNIISHSDFFKKASEFVLMMSEVS